MKAMTTQSNPVAGQSFSNPTEHGSFRKDPFEEQADNQEKAGRVIHKALQACPSLGQESPARDVLWMTVQEEICTTTPRMIQPFGSKRPFLVTQEHATDELIT